MQLIVLVILLENANCWDNAYQVIGRHERYEEWGGKG